MKNCSFSVLVKEKRSAEWRTCDKAELNLTKKQKEYEHFVRTPFHTPCPARYSVLHLTVYCRAVKVLVICLAQLCVIFLLCKSDIALQAEQLYSIRP